MASTYKSMAFFSLSPSRDLLHFLFFDKIFLTFAYSSYILENQCKMLSFRLQSFKHFSKYNYVLNGLLFINAAIRLFCRRHGFSVLILDVLHPFEWRFSQNLLRYNKHFSNYNPIIRITILRTLKCFDWGTQSLIKKTINASQRGSGNSDDGRKPFSLIVVINVAS